MWPSGSSPREWGTLAARHPHAAITRFIPTRVGNTTLLCAGNATSAVHPHASGEHTGTRPSDVLNDGSSPREWGTLAEEVAEVWLERFIPTRVGNTAKPKATPTSKAVHPHASGEHTSFNSLIIKEKSRSPKSTEQIGHFDGCSRRLISRLIGVKTDQLHAIKIGGHAAVFA